MKNKYQDMKERKMRLKQQVRYKQDEERKNTFS